MGPKETHYCKAIISALTNELLRYTNGKSTGVGSE